jgi:hypothetical protein
MLTMSLESQLQWKKKAVQAYFDKVDKFLERLLLLIHMTWASHRAVRSSLACSTATPPKDNTVVSSLKKA